MRQRRLCGTVFLVISDHWLLWYLTTDSCDIGPLTLVISDHWLLWYRTTDSCDIGPLTLSIFIKFPSTTENNNFRKVFKQCATVQRCLRLAFYTVRTALNGVIIACCMDVRTFVRYERQSRSVRLSTANKWLDLEVPCFAHERMQPIFIQILNVLDLHYQGQRLESSTLGSEYVIISQTMTNIINIAIAKTENHIWPVDWHIYI